MRIVRGPSELADVLSIASHEAEKAFSDGTLYLEKYFENPVTWRSRSSRTAGATACTSARGTARCRRTTRSWSRRAPRRRCHAELRARMCGDAVRLLRGLGYTGAGTVEFLVKNGKHWFMEVNARVQVEHPVSEMVTGVDIIRQQILAASDEALEVSQEEVCASERTPSSAGSTPARRAGSPGSSPPGGFGVRVDTYLHDGGRGLPVLRPPRGKAHRRGEEQDGGPAPGWAARSRSWSSRGSPRTSTQQARIIAHPVFRRGIYGTGFIGRHAEGGPDVIEFGKQKGWIRYLTDHPVRRKRDERLFIDEKHSCPSCQSPLTAEEMEAHAVHLPALHAPLPAHRLGADPLHGRRGGVPGVLGRHGDGQSPGLPGVRGEAGRHRRRRRGSRRPWSRGCAR